MRIINKFRGAPLIQPILYRSAFYSLVVLVVRFIEKVVEFALNAQGFGAAFRHSMHDFTWHTVRGGPPVWIFICFSVYVAATELNALLGEATSRGCSFIISRQVELRLNRRQHVRALMELSRLAENTPREQLLDPATPQGSRLVAIVDALRRRPAPST